MGQPFSMLSVCSTFQPPSSKNWILMFWIAAARSSCSTSQKEKDRVFHTGTLEKNLATLSISNHGEKTMASASLCFA